MNVSIFLFRSRVVHIRDKCTRNRLLRHVPIYVYVRMYRIFHNSLASNVMLRGIGWTLRSILQLDRLNISLNSSCYNVFHYVKIYSSDVHTLCLTIIDDV